MTLSQIDKRLSLYGEWLEYSLRQSVIYDMAKYNAYEIYSVYRRTGIMFLNNTHQYFNGLNTFDEWLVIGGHDDLVIKD